VLKARSWSEEEGPQQAQGAVHWPGTSVQQFPEQFQSVQPQRNLLQLRQTGAPGTGSQQKYSAS